MDCNGVVEILDGGNDGDSVSWDVLLVKGEVGLRLDALVNGPAPPLRPNAGPEPRGYLGHDIGVGGGVLVLPFSQSVQTLTSGGEMDLDLVERTSLAQSGCASFVHLVLHPSCFQEALDGLAGVREVGGESRVRFSKKVEGCVIVRARTRVIQPKELEEEGELVDFIFKIFVLISALKRDVCRGIVHAGFEGIENGKGVVGT